MAVRTASAAAAGDKWKAVTPGRMNYYVQGVQGGAQAYEEGVRGAGDRYAAGVTQAISDRMWESGVEGKGSKFAMKAASIGGGRWSEGVNKAQSDYTTAIAPFLQAINGMSLPPAGPKGYAGNYARSQAVGEALRAVKVRR